MYLAVKEVCNTFNATWAGIIAFVAAFGDFTTKVDELLGLVEVQLAATTGVTDDKNEARDVVITKTLALAAGVSAYAKDNNDNTLQEKVHVTKSELDNARDTIVAQTAQLIIDEATAVVASLGDYNVTALQIADLQTAKDDYTDKIGTPRAAIGNRHSATDGIEDKIGEIDVLLKERMDKLVDTLQVSAPDFYSQYSSARLIVDTGVRTALKGTVTDADTTVAIKGANVFIVELDRSKKTNANGNYRFGRLRGGIYTLQVTAKGYEMAIIEDVVVEDGHVADVDVALVTE